jgi:FkbM family methyltransferase
MDAVISRELSNVDLFVDVGANIGQTYLRLRKLGFEGNYLAVEPELSSFNSLINLTNSDFRAICLNSAVGSRSGRVMLNVASNSSLSSSILDFSDNHLVAAPWIRMQSTQEVEMETLSNLLSQSSARRIFLKIDVQGYELEVLRGIRDEDWQRIEVILVECNLINSYTDASLIEDVFTLLRKRNFNPFRIENGFGMPDFGQQLQVDVLFKRIPA